MLLYEGLEEAPVVAKSTVAIGAFDGIHCGHRAIIRRAVEDGNLHGRPAVVFTFDRHPADLLRPERSPDYITTPKQRRSLIESLGVDRLVIARFDAALAQLSAADFVKAILCRRLGARCVVVGSDFRFAKDRSGDVATLRTASAGAGYEVVALDAVVTDGVAVSSTRIRELIAAGEIEQAERALGHPYLFAGRVVPGRRIGRELGFPTANIERSWRQVVPGDGIYAVYAHLDDGRRVGGACSIGTRPTIEAQGERTVEAHLFDFDEDLYGREMEIRFVKYLRHEEKFHSIEALKSQMAADTAMARSVLKEAEQ